MISVPLRRRSHAADRSVTLTGGFALFAWNSLYHKGGIKTHVCQLRTSSTHFLANQTDSGTAWSTLLAMT